MKRWHYFAAGFALVLAIIQLVPNELPPASSENKGDLLSTALVNPEITTILKTSCYNCHSNETIYPWYSHVAPVSWLVASDVREGREELNFSHWQEYELTKMLGKLEDISTEVSEGRMPMKIYTLIHPAASLDANQRDLIVAWAEATMDKVAEEEEGMENEEETEEENN